MFKWFYHFFMWHIKGYHGHQCPFVNECTLSFQYRWTEKPHATGSCCMRAKGHPGKHIEWFNKKRMNRAWNTVIKMKHFK